MFHHKSMSRQDLDIKRQRVTPFRSGLFSGSKHLPALAGISLNSWAISFPIFFPNMLFNFSLLGSFCAMHDE